MYIHTHIYLHIYIDINKKNQIEEGPPLEIVFLSDVVFASCFEPPHLGRAMPK